MRTRTAALSAVLLGALVVPSAATARTSAAPPGADAPPMGWNSRALGCSVSEAAVRRAADALADGPLAAAGYRYVIVDGCWTAAARDASGGLVADPARFPSGIRALADHVHGRGLKLGLGLSAGTKACAGGGAGAYRHEDADGALLRSWGVDYLKYDWCSIPTADFPGKNVQQIAQILYPAMRQALGDGIAFAMNNEEGSTVPWLWGREVATTWRTNVVTKPLTDSYAHMVDVWETNMLRHEYAGPGSWNDPDLLQAGLGKMTEREYRAQFSLWAIGASPLILQADPAKAPAAIVANPKVIAVNQDRLGVQSRYARTDGWYHALVKPLENGDSAVVLFNESDRAATIAVTAAKLKPSRAPRYRVEDLWTGEVAETQGDLAAYVPAHGAVMYRVARDAGDDRAAPLVTLETDPAATLGEDRLTTLTAGREGEIVTRLVNTGGTKKLTGAEISLTLPDGWRARPVTPAASPEKLAAGEAFTVTWAVTPPAGAAAGRYEIGAKASFDGRAEVTSSAAVLVAPAP